MGLCWRKKVAISGRWNEEVLHFALAYTIRDEDLLYHKMTLSEFQELADFVSWQPFFSAAFAKVGRAIDSSEPIVVYAPTYMRNLSSLVAEYMNDTQRQTDLENYMVWQLVKSLQNTLSKPYRDSGKGLVACPISAESGLNRDLFTE